MFSRLTMMNQFSLFHLQLQVGNSSDNDRDDLHVVPNSIIIIVVVVVVVEFLGSVVCTLERKFGLTSWSDKNWSYGGVAWIRSQLNKFDMILLRKKQWHAQVVFLMY